MRRTVVGVVLFLILLSFPLAAVPESSGKLAGTETAYIDSSYANIGIMDTTVNLFEVVSLKSNLLFDIVGLYNIGVKAGYHFRSFLDLRVAAGYTWFLLNEKQVLLGMINNLEKDSGITVNSLDLGIKGQKIYAAAMLPLSGVNIHTNFSFILHSPEEQFMKCSLGVEKTFFANHLAVYADGGMYFNLPESSASASVQSIYFNTLVSNLYADGGIRVFIGEHFNIELGGIYPGIHMPLGTDADTGEEKVLNFPVIPVFNIAYRL